MRKARKGQMMFIVTSLKSRLAKKDFKQAHNGANFCVCSLATNKVAFDQESGSWVTQSTCFLDFIAFDYNASKLEHAQVGDIIAISGELAQENYRDSAGNPRTSYKIIIKDLVISPKQSAQNAQAEPSAAGQARQNFAPQAQPQDVRSQWAQAPQAQQAQPAQLPGSAQVKRALSQRPASAQQAQNFDNLRPGDNWDKAIIDDNFPNDDDIPF